MNWSGGTSPRTGWRQRTSASKPLPAAGLDLEERLIMHLELAARDGVAQVAFERVAGFELRRHRLVVDREAVAARRFRPVQRQVGLLQKLLPVDAVLRHHRDADAGADLDLAARAT